MVVAHLIYPFYTPLGEPDSALHGLLPYYHRMRVISLLPSATETLCLLGGSAMLVGRSHECDFPDEIRDRPVLTSPTVGFTTSAKIDDHVGQSMSCGESLYRLDAALLADLRPDVILTQDLCSVCSIDLEAVQRVAAQLDPAPAIVSVNPTTIEDVLDDALKIAAAVGLEAEAQCLVVSLRDRLHRAGDCIPAFVDGPSVAVLEWVDPIYVGGHWTPQLVERAGGSHPLNPTSAIADAGSGVAAQLDQRVAGPSIRIESEQLVASQPEAIIITPCGLDLATTRREAVALTQQSWWAELPAVKQGMVALVDGNQMFNRPGPRIVDTFEWLVGWLNDRPERMPENFPWEPLA